MRQDGSPLTRGREYLQKRAQCVRAPAADALGRPCARVLTWERARRSAAADPGGPRQGHDRRSVEGVAAAVGTMGRGRGMLRLGLLAASQIVFYPLGRVIVRQGR